MKFGKIAALPLLAWFPLFAELPYGLRPEIDIPAAAGIVALKYHANSRLAETRARPLDLGGLSKEDLPGFDRWAVGFYSEDLSAFSSVLAATILAVPAAVNTLDTYRGRQAWHGFIT